MVTTRRTSQRLRAKVEAQSTESPAKELVEPDFKDMVNTPLVTGTPKSSSSTDPFDPDCDDFVLTPYRARKRVLSTASEASTSTPIAASTESTKKARRSTRKGKSPAGPSIGELSPQVVPALVSESESATPTPSLRRSARRVSKAASAVISSSASSSLSPPSIIAEDTPTPVATSAESPSPSTGNRRSTRSLRTRAMTPRLNGKQPDLSPAADPSDLESDIANMSDCSDSSTESAVVDIETLAIVEIMDDDPNDSGYSDTSVRRSVSRPARRSASRSRQSRPARGRRAPPAPKPKPITLEERHPSLVGAWDRLAATVGAKDIQHEQPADLKLKLLPFQRESLTWMIRQERDSIAKGGILADEMGMGKTIQMIALLLSEPRSKPNLVVAPTVAILQWLAEIRTHTSELSATLYYGKDRALDPGELEKYDVVLTSYSLVEGAFRRERYGARRKGEMVKEKSVLHSVNWHRVILDEAHCIKDRSCNTARASFALNSTYKWALSGTPLQNRVGELYSLIRFMQLDPYSYYFCRDCDCKSLTWKFTGGRECDECGHKPMRHLCWWNQEILKPIQNFGARFDGAKAFVRLRDLLQNIMIRRTKLERAEDLGLPPRNVVIRYDRFNEEESDLYRSLFANSATQFNTFVAHNTVLSHYANIFELLTRLRLATNHPILVTTKLKEKYGIGSIASTNTLVCAVCQDVPEDPIVAKCKHVFCREDAMQYIESSLETVPRCPTCFANLTIDLTQPTLEVPGANAGDDETTASRLLAGVAQGDQKEVSAELVRRVTQPSLYRESIVNRLDLSQWQSSTKIEALVEELTNLRQENATIKSIVFSQFVNFLDIVQWRLTRSGFGCCRLDGRMGAQQRDAVIRAFSTLPEYTVFLISLKAGGVALNLTEASRVFICDPWWNPAVEDQAMDRIHRLGQFRPIKITRLIIEDSIESRIIELQEKKRALFQSTIGQDTSAMSRLTQEDLQFLFVL